MLAITADIDGESYYWKGADMVGRFLEKLAEYPKPWVHYAHHAQYDWRYILPYVAEHKIPCEIQMRTESDIYEVALKIGKNKIVMRDSMAMWIGKLDDLAKNYAPEFPKLTIDITKFDPDNPEHEAYARRDAKILAVALPRLNAKLERHFGVTLGVTAASTALKAWQETLRDDEIYSCSTWGKREEFIRSAYFGGLVFLTRNDRLQSDTGDAVAVTYDRNSSYPAAMCEHGVPHGRVGVSSDYKQGKMGIYRVRVRAPEGLIIPILPRRNEKGHMAWNRGEFDTTVTNRELIFACNHGYEIIDIYQGIYFEETIFPFNSFIDLCKQIRFEYQGLAEEELAKRMQNSLYGKFGSRRQRKRMFIPQSNEDMKQGRPLEACDYFWMRTEFADQMKCMPHWAVFITAHARLSLLQNAYACGPENVLYGDTDSLTILTGHDDSIDVGRDYGQWKLEKVWSEFRAIAPKVYAGRLLTDAGKKKAGDYLGAAKGVPRRNLDTQNWLDLLERGKTVAGAYSLSSLRVGLAKGFKEAQYLERVSTAIENSANWELRGNLVRPKIAA